MFFLSLLYEWINSMEDKTAYRAYPPEDKDSPAYETRMHIIFTQKHDHCALQTPLALKIHPQVSHEYK
jgi:hypothetical protein